MKLTIINGSPRTVATSNTNLLLQRFGEGFQAAPGNRVETVHLRSPGGIEKAVAAFGEAEAVLIGFPLYTDAMPGIVKELIEALSSYRGQSGNPALMFLVQSGFPEGSHTRHLVPYLEKLARRLGCDYRGTIRKGGVEGIRIQPPLMTRTLFEQMRTLGAGVARTGKLDEAILRKLAGKERLSRVRLIVASKVSELLFWNPQLKKNGAFERRFAKPCLLPEP